MARKRHTAEQIIGKLRTAEVWAARRPRPVGGPGRRPSEGHRAWADVIAITDEPNRRRLG